MEIFLSSTKRKASEHDGNPAKASKAGDKSKCTNKHRYRTKYNPEWAKFPVQRANNNPYAFSCIPCKKNDACEFQGKRDVERHCDSGNKNSSHNKMVNALKNMGRQM